MSMQEFILPLSDCVFRIICDCSAKHDFFPSYNYVVSRCSFPMLLKFEMTVMHQSIPAAPIPPPGQLRGICVPRQSRGWGIKKFGTARGSGICLNPRAFDTHVVSDSKSKHGGFYRKGPAVRRRLDRLPRTGQTCGGFLDFMHFFIAHQGTTIT